MKTIILLAIVGIIYTTSQVYAQNTTLDFMATMKMFKENNKMYNKQTSIFDQCGRVMENKFTTSENSTAYDDYVDACLKYHVKYNTMMKQFENSTSRETTKILGSPIG